MSHPLRGTSGLGGQPKQRARASENSNSKFATIGAIAAIGIALGVLAVIGFANPAGFIAVNGSLSSTATSLITLGASAVAVPSLYMLAKRVESFVNGKNVSEREKKVLAVALGILSAGFIVTGLVFGGHLILSSPAYAGALGGSIGLLATLAIEKLSKTKYYSKHELGELRSDVFEDKKYYIKKSFLNKPGLRELGRVEVLNEAFKEKEVYIKEEEGFRKLGIKESWDLREALDRHLDDQSEDGDSEVSAADSVASPPGYKVEDEKKPLVGREHQRVRGKRGSSRRTRQGPRVRVPPAPTRRRAEVGDGSDIGAASESDALPPRSLSPTARRSYLPLSEDSEGQPLLASVGSEVDSESDSV